MSHMSNTTTQPTADLAKMVKDFFAARYDANHNRLGTTKQVRGEARMDRIVEKAERLGVLREFLAAVNNVSDQVWYA